MKASDLMTRNPDFCVPEDRLSNAIRIMQSSDVGSVPIVATRTDLRPVGVVTDRDVALYLGNHDGRASDFLCRDVMTSPVVSVDISEDADEVYDRMAKHQLRRILVVDSGRLVGIVAQADVAREKPKDAGKVVEKVSKPAA